MTSGFNFKVKGYNLGIYESKVVFLLSFFGRGGIRRHFSFCNAGSHFRHSKHVPMSMISEHIFNFSRLSSIKL